MPTIVPFTIRCSTCAGTGVIKSTNLGYGNTGETDLPDCWLCGGKGYLHQARCRLDKLHILHKRREAREIMCQICHGTGHRQDKPDKPCKACLGYKIDPHRVILTILGKQISLYNHITKDD